MNGNEQIIANFEIKIKQLITENNANHESGDMSRGAFRSYCENAERIDRLKFAIEQLKKRTTTEINDKAKDKENGL